MSHKLQFIIVMIILGLVLVWVIYSLVRKPGKSTALCAGCALAENCKKKELHDRELPPPASCEECPEKDSCYKRDTQHECNFISKRSNNSSEKFNKSSD